MKNIRSGVIVIQLLMAFVVLLFAASVRADTAYTPSGKQTEAENTENARMYAGVLCTAETPEVEIQCGLLPLRQVLGIVITKNYIDSPSLFELADNAQTAMDAGMRHIEEFSYKESNIKNLDIPPWGVLGTNKYFVPNVWQEELLTLWLQPITKKLQTARPHIEKMGPRAFELLLKETRDVAIWELTKTLQP